MAGDLSGGVPLVSRLFLPLPEAQEGLPDPEGLVEAEQGAGS